MSKVPVIVTQLCPECYLKPSSKGCKRCKESGYIHYELEQTW